MTPSVFDISEVLVWIVSALLIVAGEHRPSLLGMVRLLVLLAGAYGFDELLSPLALIVIVEGGRVVDGQGCGTSFVALLGGG